MKERPILMSAPMVRAILAGTKTQTRRVVKVQLEEIQVRTACSYSTLLRNCPYGQPGERLTVKEHTWMWCEKRPNGTTKKGRPKFLYVPLRAAPVIYCTDRPERPQTDVVSPETSNPWGWRWKAARYMPKWASRITLELTGVRVERLQDISEADAIAEGTDLSRPDMQGMGVGKYNYAHLWESINGPGSWELNPFVWVLEFRKP